MHPLDPPAQHHAAGRAGVLAARGLVDGGALLATIGRTARRAAPRCDRRGLAMRLVHTYEDARIATLAEDDAVRRRVLGAVAPLLAARAPQAGLMAAAAAADPAGALSAGELRALVAGAVGRFLAMRRFGGVHR